MSSGMIKTTVREIKGSLGRYLAIFAIVMLGVGLFSGLKATTPAMIATENDYLEEQNFFDLRLLSAIGFRQEDVEELKRLEETADVEGAVSADAICDSGDGNESVYKFHTVPDAVSRLVVTAGRLPERADECVLDSALYGEEAIGSKIRVTDNNDEDTLEMFGERTFTAVGIVRSPYYINFERGTSSIGDGRVTAFLYVPKEAFSCDYLTEIYVTAKQKYDVYTDEYEDYIDSILDGMEDKTESLVLDRYDELVSEAQEKIDDAQAELDDKKAEAEKELSDGLQKIKDGQKEIRDAEKELLDGGKKIADGEKEIADGEQEIREHEIEIADGEREIREKEQQLRDGEAELSQYEQEIADGEQKLSDGRAQLTQAKAQLKKQETQLQKQEAKLLKQEAALPGQQAELNSKKKELDTTEKTLNTQEAELNSQQAELDSREKALDGQQAELDSQEAELKGRQAELDARETELNSQKEQLEQAYGAQAVTEEQYKAHMAELEAGLAQVQNGQQQVQAGLIQVQDGQKQLQDGRKQLQDGRKQLEAGLAQVRDGQKQVRDGQKQVQAGLIRLRDGEKKIAAGKKEIQAGKNQISAAKKELSQKEKELKASQEELQTAKHETASARAQLESGRRELAEGKAELADGRAELEDGKAELVNARAELAKAKEELEKGRAELKDGRKELADAKKEYADAKAEFETKTADAQRKIDDARAELADIEEPDSYVLTRNTNIGYACYESDSNIVAAIANVFPVFFFLVAALVCMTTMNRMIEEQRTQIGVLKALGYGDAAIMGKYLFYAGSAAVLGAAAGCLGGTWLFPKVIWMGYSIMYSMGDIEYIFDVRLALLSLAAALLCSVGAAYFSCRYELYSVPANLIRPKAPKSGKRIFLERLPFIWTRMKFLHKVSMRNIVRYKKRFFMMVLGIGGCTALLVTGFGIKDSVTNVADMQYDEIQIYDIGVTFADGVHKTDMEEMVAQSDGMLTQASCRYEESVDLDFDGKTKSVYLEIPENAEETAAFLNLHTKDGETIPYPSQGEAVLTAKLAENMGIRPGDTAVLRDSGMNSITVTVSALCENFVYNYIYISKETYENQLGKEPEYKSAYVLADEGTDVHEAAAFIADGDNVLAVSITADMRERIGAMMESMDYIVLLIIICAGSLAFIVLYNLTNINITERIREIATIKVLGFYAKETADYVFRENLALTAIGAVLGLGLGKWLHAFVMYQVNIDMLSFKTLIQPVSYLWSLLFTFAFAVMVNGFMYFKLEKINMAESLKSIE